MNCWLSWENFSKRAVLALNPSSYELEDPARERAIVELERTEHNEQSGADDCEKTAERDGLEKSGDPPVAPLDRGPEHAQVRNAWRIPPHPVRDVTSPIARPVRAVAAADDECFALDFAARHSINGSRPVVARRPGVGRCGDGLDTGTSSG